MKKNTENTEKKKMTAISYMKNFAETQSVMESIASKTESEQKVLLENNNPFGDSDDEGNYDMDRLLDVKLPEDFNEPRIYNSPAQEFSSSDKELIANSFAKRISEMKEDAIDLEQLGPVYAAISMEHGYPISNVEEFINHLIQTNANNHNSQNMALGVDEIPGMAELEDAPDMASDLDVVVSAPVETTPVSEVPVSSEDAAVLPVEEPIVDDSTEELPAEVAADLSVETPAAPVEPEEVAPAANDLPKEEEHVEMAKDLKDMAKEDGNEEAEKVAGKLEKGESEEVKELKDEEPASEEESEEDENKKVESKLEAIKENYRKAALVEAEEKQLTAQFEAIKNKYLGKTIVENEEPSDKKKVETEEVVEKKPVMEEVSKTCPECKVSGKVHKKDCSFDKKPMVEEDEGSEGSDDAMVEGVSKLLESIVTEYHATEKAKENATKKDQEVSARLESIATEYHANLKAKEDAAKKDSEISAKLESLVTDFKDKSAKAKLESVESRKTVKARLTELSK